MMIKKIIFSSIFTMLNLTCYCQNRENVWELGQGAGFNDSIYPKCGIVFNNSEADTFSVIRDIGFVDCSTEICDTSGVLQFYFNGIILNNKLNQQMENSDSLNPGPYNGNDWDNADGTLILEGATTIPRPNYSNQYYLVYENINYVKSLGYPSLHLRYSLIDMSRDSGIGAIVKGKRLRSVVNDTLDQGAISVCKHANGRDWWIVTRKFPTNQFYKVLVSPDTMIVYSQSIGISFQNLVDYERWSVFSPDGSKYAYQMSNFSGTDSVELMDFDRCSGEFSNPISWRLPNTYGVSCIFSPNSRFLYCVQNNNLYQYDTYTSDIPNSLIKVDTFDGTADSIYGIPAWFAQSQLAPDGKIYLGTWGSFKALGVINDPDSLGKACNFTQHSFALPFYNFCTPYYPNYDLGPLVGSQCDTITSVSRFGGMRFRISIFPNPVSQWLNIEYESMQNLQCGIYDITGKLITSFTLFQYFKNRMFDMSKLSDGIYILNVKSENGDSKSWKIVKERTAISY